MIKFCQLSVWKLCFRSEIFFSTISCRAATTGAHMAALYAKGELRPLTHFGSLHYFDIWLRRSLAMKTPAFLRIFIFLNFFPAFSTPLISFSNSSQQKFFKTDTYLEKTSGTHKVQDVNKTSGLSQISRRLVKKPLPKVTLHLILKTL